MQPHRSTEWFETFFQGVAVKFWSQVLPPALTVQEADFLEQALALAPGARLLDVPCGHGRHAIELARRGYRVTGIDLSADALHLASESAAGAQVDIDWRPGDMRDLPIGESEFDASYCFGNSFGYLDHHNAGLFLGALAGGLKPGARLAIDTGVAAESILPALLPQRWHRRGDVLMLSAARYSASDSRLDIDYTFVENGSIETRASSSYVFTVAELRRMLKQAGFEVLQLTSGYSGEDYRLGSPRLIIVARRE